MPVVINRVNNISDASKQKNEAIDPIVMLGSHLLKNAGQFVNFTEFRIHREIFGSKNLEKNHISLSIEQQLEQCGFNHF